MNSERIKKLKYFTHQKIFEYFYLKNTYLLEKKKIFPIPKKRFEKNTVKEKQ